MSFLKLWNALQIIYVWGGAAEKDFQCIQKVIKGNSSPSTWSFELR